MNQLPTKATHQQTKTYNSQLVLKTIFDNGQISRAQVARLTHLTRVTVSEIVADLIGRGLVAEIGRGPSTGGKSPILLSVVDDAYHLIGADLADEEFRGAVVNLRGEICHAVNLPRQGRDDEQALAMVYELIDSLIATNKRPLLGIGIGTPGLIDTANGVVLQAVNLSWKDLPLGKLLAERYDLPVYIANDGQVAALAEYLFGNCESSNNLIAIKLGNGIGSGIVFSGHLYQGDGFGAGEIGHVRMVEDGQLCRCGNTGCLETIASCSAILRRAQELAPTHPNSLLNEIANQPEDITIKVVASAFQNGDELARRILQEAGQYLGRMIATMISVLNIQNILLVGDIAAFGQEWLQIVKNEIYRSALPALVKETDVNFGCLDQGVVILGASALLLNRELGLSLIRYPGSHAIGAS